jgi:Gamma interferon inducible lysosomal thiol reductase (GILT)
MPTSQTDKDETRTPPRSEGGIQPGVAIVGFLICFVAGAGIMWGFDAKLGRSATAGITADTAGGAAKQVSANAVHVDLHVMAQCPYGVQAEGAFKDVVSKLGSDVDLNVEYIGQAQGGEPSSMHGANEVKGDLLQVCTKKYAPEKAFDFILCQNENNKEVGSNGAACAAKVGAPAAKITACADGQEGKELLLASFKRSQDKGASGSPTIFIAGNKYEGGRKPTDIVKAICNGASDKKPAACASIPESPKVNVTILSDKRCGADCDPSRLEGSVRGAVGAPVVTELDYSSPEGKQLFGSLGSAMLPLAVFDATLDADKDAVAALSRGLKDAGGHRVLSTGSWNPSCADDGGCKLDACKATMQCRPELPKKLDVFVMAQCPYGVKGLDAMKEVTENFKKAGESVEFAVHYIGDGDASSLSSMHGPGEVAEDIREECAIKHYGKSLKYMDYVWCRNKSIRDTNWESCTGGSTGIDADVIKKCAEGDEGKQLVAHSFAESKALGIGASPTWLANNKYKFSGIDAQTIKSNLCSHNAKLAGCDAALSGQAPAKPGAKEPGCGN